MELFNKQEVEQRLQEAAPPQEPKEEQMQPKAGEEEQIKQQQPRGKEEAERQEEDENQQKEWREQDLQPREGQSQQPPPAPLLCRESSIIYKDQRLKETDQLPVDADDVGRAKRMEELRKKNAVFWKNMFVESGVRKKERKAQESVWKQRLTIAAVIVLVAAGISQALYRAYIDVNFGFKHIDVKDTERLKEVMFGGHPWIVLCRWAERKQNVPEIFHSHRRELTAFGNLGSLDCSASLPSGKTFSERFRIPSSTDAIVVTNGKTPRALNAWTFKTWENLSFFLQKSTRVEVTKIEDNTSFVKSCLYPPGARCISFLRKGGFSPESRKSIAAALAKKGATRKLKAVTLDSAKYQLTGVYIRMEPVYTTKVACFGNITAPPSPEAKKSYNISDHSFIFSLYEGDFTDSSALSTFAEQCIHSKPGAENFSTLTQVPGLKRKPSPPSSSSSYEWQ